MKKLLNYLILGLFLCFLVNVIFSSTLNAEYTTKVYRDQNGDRQVIASGGVLQIDQGGTLKANDLILDPTVVVADSIGGATTYQMTWPDLDSTDSIVATMTQPVTATLYAAKANTGYATFYFSAALSYATMAAVALKD